MGILTNAADNFRCVTMVATTGSPATLQIQKGETAELVASMPMIKEGGVQTTFQIKSGGGGQWGFGIPVTGPATITANSDGRNPAFITVKITPDSCDANQTVMLPPGTNQVYVALESSTNLVNWSLATNGFYGGPDAVLFFRIRTNALASP